MVRLPGPLQHVMDHGIPGKARYRYIFGSGLMFAMVLQVVTGIAMAFYYVPSAKDAYASVYTIQNEVTLGWLTRGMHHFGASVVIVLACLHLLQVFLSGAYRRPRHWNWVSGVLLLGIILAFGLTGYLLPWDQKGYWATKVATNIAGGVPLGGEQIQALAQGGAEYSTATLTRFYALHVFALPLGLVALVIPHMTLFLKHGVTAPEEDQKSGRSEPFWPFQAFYDLVFMVLVLVTILLLTVYLGAPLDAPADPSGSYDARPEWYFLFLFQLLKYFEGPMVLVGTVILPTLAALFLLGLPWLDRAADRSLKSRWKVVVPFSLGVLGVVFLTVQAYRSDANSPDYQTRVAQQQAEAAFALEHAKDGFTPEGTIPALERRRDFDRLGCSSCHRAEDRGGAKAPALDDFASRAWMLGQIEHPDAPERFGNTELKEEMPAADETLSKDDRAAMVEFLVQRTGLEYEPAVNVELAKKGEALLEESDCAGCHATTADAMSGPSLLDYGSKNFLRQVIRDPSHELLYGDLNKMPSFAHLSDEQIDELILYIQSLRTDGPPN